MAVALLLLTALVVLLALLVRPALVASSARAVSAVAGPGSTRMLSLGPDGGCASEKQSHHQAQTNPEPSHWFSSFVVAVRCPSGTVLDTSLATTR
jgi:hypothetical protein